MNTENNKKQNEFATIVVNLTRKDADKCSRSVARMMCEDPIHLSDITWNRLTSKPVTLSLNDLDDYREQSHADIVRATLISAAVLKSVDDEEKKDALKEARRVLRKTLSAIDRELDKRK